MWDRGGAGTYGGVDPPDGTLAHRDARVVYRGKHRGKDGRGGGRAAARGKRPVRDHSDVQAAPRELLSVCGALQCDCDSPVGGDVGICAPGAVEDIGPVGWRKVLEVACDVALLETRPLEHVGEAAT